MLTIKNFTKTYKGGKKAVDNLSLSVEDGDIYGFIGHNGAGKTTTIKAVVGIMVFDEVQIEIDGMSIRERPVDCKRITAYIPDNPDLYENLTGIQYLNFIGDVFAIPKGEREELISHYADLFEITPVSYTHLSPKRKKRFWHSLYNMKTAQEIPMPFFCYC